MRKIIVVILIALLVFGGALKTYGINHGGDPFSASFYNCSFCLQSLSWILFSVISGITLLIDPEPFAAWLGKIFFKNIEAKFTPRHSRILGLLLLGMLPLNSYVLQNDCQKFYNLLLK
jgi:hypothetical protein